MFLQRYGLESSLFPSNLVSVTESHQTFLTPSLLLLDHPSAGPNLLNDPHVHALASSLKTIRAMAILRIWMRRTVAKYGARAQHVAAARIQRAWLRKARNRRLQERVGRVFAMARAGDVDGMMQELRANPDVLFMRDRC